MLRRPPVPVEPAAGSSAGNLVMLLFLASLGMGFGAVFAFYFIMRERAAAWPPEGAALPAGLWVSTALIVLTTISLLTAQRALKANRQRRVRGALLAALVFAIAFLGAQGINWGVAGRAGLLPRTGMFAITFYLLTGLHALHTLAGLVPLAVVNVRAARGAYTPFHRAGVHYCAIYWHFVDAVWLAMFATLWWGS